MAPDSALPSGAPSGISALLEERRRFRERVLGRELLLGLFLQLGSAVAAEVGGRLGFDWALIDLEHGAGGEAELLSQLHALATTRTPAIVRVESGARLRIGRALDLGAAGVMVPQVNSPAMAREVTSYLWYPPLGARGIALSSRGASFGAAAHGDVRPLSESTLGILQVETAAAVDCVEEIAAIDGADVLFVGPTDLSHSLGVPGAFNDPRFNAAISRIARAAQASGRAAGVHLPFIRELGRYRDLGFTFVSVAADGTSLSAALAANLKAAREV